MEKRGSTYVFNLKKLQRQLLKLNPEETINKIQNAYSIEKSPKKNNITEKNLKDEFSNNITSIKIRENISKDKKFQTSLLSELDYLSKIYIERFATDSQKKRDIEAKNFIPLKEKEYEKRVQLVVKKAEEELNSYMQKLQNIEQKNKELRDNIQMVNNQKLSMESQLKDAEISIKKINKKYEIFNDLKPYYDELVVEFDLNQDEYNNKEKLLSKDIRNRRKEVEYFKEEIKEKREEIHKLVESKHREDFMSRKTNEELSTNLRSIELKNKNLEEDYNSKFTKIKQEIDYLTELKEKNIRIRNTFVTIFNIFYNDLYLERDLNTKPPGIELIKSDYTPNTYITDEVVKYIILMIKNCTEESTGILLREIVSYVNMMLRNTNNENEKMTYDPVKAVKKIENLISSVENKSSELKEIINKNSKKNEENQKIINDYEVKIQRYEKMHDVLQNLMRDYFSAQKASLKNTNLTKLLMQNAKPLKQYNISNLNSFMTNSKEKSSKAKQKHEGSISHELSEDLKRIRKSKSSKQPEFDSTVRNLVDHANRIFFYQAHLHNTPKEAGVYIKAHKRINRKLRRLRQLDKYNVEFASLENTVVNMLNNNLDKLITEIKSNK